MRRALLILIAWPAVSFAGDSHAPPPLEQEEAVPVAPAPVAGPPAGWTMVQPPTAPLPPAPIDNRPLAIPASSAMPPPPGSSPAAAPQGWTEVAPPAGVQRVTQRPADARTVAFGGAVGGGSTAAVDVLVRLGKSTVLDAGIGPQLHVRTWEPVSTRLLMGLTWQPGERTGRHGVVVRGGLGFTGDGEEASETIGLLGYAWRLVPHDNPVTLELETGPIFIYREVGPHGGEYAAVNAFVRFSAHGWMR